MPRVLQSEYQARIKALGNAAGLLLSQQWSSGGLWLDRLTVAAGILAVAQQRAAGLADGYVDSYGSGAAEFTVDPAAFSGMASDGRPLDSLLVGASVAANAKADATEAAKAGRAWLLMAARTQVADAGRAALQVSLAVWDMRGVRVANPPCCGRCAVLAGRVYHWSAGFQRHPGCDCTMRPKPGSESIAEDEEIPLDQIRGLSQADRQAVEMGADLTAVVNAQRGMYTADVFGRSVKATFDSTMHRDSKFARRDHPNAPRLRPESILRLSEGNRDEAMRLLRRFGYIK